MTQFHENIKGALSVGVQIKHHFLYMYMYNYSQE